MYLKHKTSISLIIMILAVSCMDPVLEPDENYSDFTESTITNLLVNSDEGFTNGGFENGLETWSGQITSDFDDNEGYFRVQTSGEDSVNAPEGEKYLKIMSKRCADPNPNPNEPPDGTGLYTYIEYNPSDTLEISFQYMIPTSVPVVDGQSASMLISIIAASDEDENFLEFSPNVHCIDSTNENRELKHDGYWHRKTISFSTSDYQARSTFFGLFLQEWSNYHWAYDSTSFFAGPGERQMVMYLDDFQVNMKTNANTAPSSYNILTPANGDKYNLDTISFFQTIPFEWEEAADSDTVKYTNRLVCKVPCENALVSDGFELNEPPGTFNFWTGSVSDYHMPNGYGTLGSNWGESQSESGGPPQQTIWVDDSVSRTGLFSLRMGASDLNIPSFYTSIFYRLSQVNQNLDKDRILPGTELTVRGFAMTPSDDRISGKNSTSLLISAFDNEWNNNTSPVFDSSYAADVWHPFEVSMTVPERQLYPGTTTCFLIFRYNQYDGAKGTVYFDDITISTNKPINYFVTNYHETMTLATSTMMSGQYLSTLFSFIKNDLAGISFSEVDFEWGILATDNISEIFASNSPVTFTVIDTSMSSDRVAKNLDGSAHQRVELNQDIETLFTEVLGTDYE